MEIQTGLFQCCYHELLTPLTDIELGFNAFKLVRNWKARRTPVGVIYLTRTRYTGFFFSDGRLCDRAAVAERQTHVSTAGGRNSTPPKPD